MNSTGTKLFMTKVNCLRGFFYIYLTVDSTHILKIDRRSFSYLFLQSTKPSYSNLRTVCFFSMLRFQAEIHFRTYIKYFKIKSMF